MKYLRHLAFIFGLILLGCSQDDKRTLKTEKQLETLNPSEPSKDKEEIQKLIRQVLNWSNTKRNINLLPAIPDKNDSLYIGMDLEQHKANLVKLRSTDFFATEFIENYNQIILNLNEKLRRNKEE